MEFTKSELTTLEMGLINRLNFLNETSYLPNREEKIERCNALLRKLRGEEPYPSPQCDEVQKRSV